MKSKVYYKAIFVSGDDKQSIQYIEEGHYKYHNDKHIVNFRHDDLHIKIKYDTKEVELINNASTLRMIKDQEVFNQYKSDYGYIDLKTNIVKIEADEHMLKLIYELYNNNELVSTVYLHVRIEALLA